MHSMTTNDGRFSDKYDKFRHDCSHMKKYDMTGIQIATKRSNFGVIGSHSNWEKNWSMKRKTSVMRVTKPLNELEEAHGGKFDLRRPHEVNKRMT